MEASRESGPWACYLASNIRAAPDQTRWCRGKDSRFPQDEKTSSTLCFIPRHEVDALAEVCVIPTRQDGVNGDHDLRSILFRSCTEAISHMAYMETRPWKLYCVSDVFHTILSPLGSSHMLGLTSKAQLRLGGQVVDRS